MKVISFLQQYSFVIRQITYKEKQHKTTGMDLGAFWNVLNPLLYMIVLSTYYQNVIHHDVENFPTFVFLGITMLNFYRESTTGAMHSLVANKGLIIRTRMPVEVFTYQKVFSAFKEMLYSSVALLPILWFFHIPLTWHLIFIVPVMVLTILIVTGIGKMLAVAYVYFADIDYLWSVFMTLMFFVSETFIPLNHVPESLQPLLRLNPIYLSVHLSRDAIMYGTLSGGADWMKLMMWATALYGLGQSVFKHHKNDIIGRL